ncbi:MAG: TonB-dependent receptor [Bryobacteraceae bacterium]
MLNLRPVATIALACGLLFAQTPTARITGTVYDSSAKSIPQASVTAMNQSTGTVVDAQTNDQGIFSLPFLNPGKYEVKVEAPGFRRYLRSNITMETGQVLTLDVTLEVGEVTQSVTISEAPPLLESASSSVGQLIENKNITNMPLASRRTAALVRLMGNVSFINEDLQQGQINFSLAGGRGRQQHWLMDGGNLQGTTLVTGITTFNPPVEALQEFKVEAIGYPAEIGRTMGGFISMTTRSGTNEFHGVLYEFLRNNAMDARPFFSPGLFPRKYNVFGATLGGPIRKDKTHFFFSYEGTRRRDGTTRTLNLPTQEEVRGDFTGIAGSLIDPLTRQPMPGNIIPTSRLDPVGSKLAALYPAPNVPGARSGANNFRANTVNSTNAFSVIARLDHNISAKDRIMTRFLDFRSTLTGGSVYPTPDADPNLATEFLDNWNITQSWLHSFTPTLFSDFRYTLFWRDGKNDPLVPDNGIAGAVGLKGVDPSGMPTVSVTGFTGMGRGTQVRTFQHYYPQQFIETMTWFRGKHSVKFGGEVRISGQRDLRGNTPFGSFGFNDVATGRGFGLAALLLGWTNTAQVFVTGAHARTNYYGFFIQDDWKIAPRLTLNVGLRYDLEEPRWEKNNGQNQFDPIAINPVSGTPGIITYSGRDGLSKYAHRFDKNNFGPRFGFAYRLRGDKTVLRGGYGWMYGPIYDASVGRVMQASFTDTRTFQSTNNGLTPVFLLRDGVPTPPVEERGPGFGAVKVGETPRLAPEFMDPNHRNTYAHHFSFNIQHQVFGGTLLEAGYSSNLAHRIGGLTVNINEIRPELRGATQNQRLRPFPQYGNVLWQAPNWGNSSYHALNLKVERRFSAGFNLLANYTWSKFLDDVEANAEAGGAPGNGQQSYYARALDKSFSGSDLRHRFIVSTVYEIPVGKGKRMNINSRIADAIAGGWTLGVIAEARGGLPYGVVEASNRLNSFSSSQRSHLNGDAALSASRPRSELVDRWFDISKYAFPGDGILGNAARNTGIGPGFAGLDASLLKDFRFSEKRYLQLRGEAFNLLNRPNFGLPNGSRGNAAFGRISSSQDGRVMQIGLRFVY